MIKIHITDEDNNVLGGITLDSEDLNRGGELVAPWIGQSIINELPSDKDALYQLLLKKYTKESN